ncbi:MAG: hypothetical protein WBA52_11535 [Dolichospermum sp.]
MMNNHSFKKYLAICGKQILIVGVVVICLAILLWNLYPTYYSCCDASDYWKISEDISIMKTSSVYAIRTFVYPLFISITRFIPIHLSIDLNIQYFLLSLVQLSLHMISVIALGYITYLLTNSKLLTDYAISIYGLDIFLIAYTNQILTDGIAVYLLVIDIAILTAFINNGNNKIIVLYFSFLTGLLPMIRPALILVSITVYCIFIGLYIYRVKILKSSLFVLCVSLLFFFLPWLIQFIISPATFSIVSKLGKSHLLYGSYLYKYMTIVQPEVYGYASVNESIKQLIGVCEGLQEQSTCIKEVLISHPLATFQHYITKLMAINDQVYLFPYITNFYTPFRYLWRTINCVFLASSFIGFIILTFKVIRNKKEYLFQTLCLIIIVASCLLPLINSVPEERFGLTFHPLFAICTSYFINTYKEGKNRYSRLMQLMGFTIILSLLFQFSCNIESTFTLRLNG